MGGATSDPRIPKQYRWRVRQRWVILEYAETSSLEAAARRALSEWERVYDHERFSLAIGGRTPAEKLADVFEAA